MAKGQDPQPDLSRDEIKKLVDERIAAALGMEAKELRAFDPQEVVLGTPSVLSIVKATAYAHC